LEKNPKQIPPCWKDSNSRSIRIELSWLNSMDNSIYCFRTGPKACKCWGITMGKGNYRPLIIFVKMIIQHNQITSDTSSCCFIQQLIPSNYPFCRMLLHCFVVCVKESAKGKLIYRQSLYKTKVLLFHEDAVKIAPRWKKTIGYLFLYNLKYNLYYFLVINIKIKKKNWAVTAPSSIMSAVTEIAVNFFIKYFLFKNILK